ncbi:MAG: HD domain-containing phosphohydrolase [bacterium]
MEKPKKYSIGNFEQFFVLTVLASILIIYYFIPNKIDFLNLFYIPVIFVGYYKGKKHAALGGLFSIIIVGVFAYWFPQAFFIGKTGIDILITISTWGFFLISTGYISGYLHEKLSVENKNIKSLNKSMKQTLEGLEASNKKLEESNKNLAYKAEQLVEKNTIINHVKGKLEHTLYATMDSNVAKLIIENRLHNEKSRISILFGDLVGFSKFSDKHRPEVVINELNKIFCRIEPIVFKYKGHIDKYLGDEIMCEFGAPINYKLHALHAVAAGIKMKGCLKDLEQSWKIKVGISTGYAVTGLIGKKRISYTAIGSMVNLADRLQEICPHNSIVVDENTFQEVLPYVEFNKLKAFEIKKNKNTFIQVKQKINLYSQKLENNPKDVEILFSLGKLYYSIYDVTSALNFFEKVLEIDPDNSEVKIAYADAIIKRDEYEKIAIKGKRERIAVYEILGLKNLLLDQNKIPPYLYEKYKSVEKIVDNLEDIILPSEVIDGSIGGSKVAAFISYAIADELNLPESEKNKIALGACLHDIGKEKVPHYLLNQEGILTDLEFKQIMKHSLEGMIALQSLGYNDETVLNIARDHHEYFDGSGYPEGKKGEGIPLEARIVAVADVYNALTSTRAYREPWEREAAIKEIERSAQQGKYDKKIVEVFLKLMQCERSLVLY